jgi:hypothetical protein
VFLEGLQLMDFTQDTVAVEEADVQGDSSVAHPETQAPWLREDEQHARILLESATKHQPPRAFIEGFSDLDADHLIAHAKRKCSRRTTNSNTGSARQRQGERQTYDNGGRYTSEQCFTFGTSLGNL